MKIGIPKEIKNNENRVGATPAGVKELIAHGHSVVVQHTAGEGSGFSDRQYVEAGATILPAIEDVYAAADMIIKVKEPIEPEYALVRAGQVVFTYFHFACDRTLTEAMLASGAVCIAYETVTDRAGTLPLLTPMSEVAGRMSVQQGARFLEKPQGGKGMLLGGVPGVRPARVLVLGAGVVGRNAALMAAGLGAEVTIADISLPVLRHVAETMPANVHTLFSSRHNIEQELPRTDLVIGSVLIPGAKAPKLITAGMLGLLEQGSVMVDVAIDQGGCFETSARHHTCRPRLHRRRHRPLCRGQHPGRRSAHLHNGPDQRHTALRPAPGRRRMARRLPRRPRAGRRREHRGRTHHVPTRGRSMVAAIHSPGTDSLTHP